jgi:hypothetical protein
MDELSASGPGERAPGTHWTRDRVRGGEEEEFLPLPGNELQSPISKLSH